MKYGFGVDLGGTTVKLAYFNEVGEMLHKWEIPTDTSDNGSHILPDIAAAVNGYIADNGIDKSQVIGVGIGVPGPVNSKGIVNKCINLGWGVTNIPEILTPLTGLPVKAGNDANVAALGECWMGGGKGFENMVMVTLGTGVGGGVILGGNIIHGAHGAAGELGHMVLNRDETDKCGCGKRGCVEQYCSATGIVTLAKRFLAASEEPSKLRDMPKFECKDIFDLARSGETAAMVIREQYFSLLGEFLANLCAVVDPEVIVLGGGVSKAGQELIDGMEKYFDKYAFHATKGVKFALASLGNDAGAFGAFKLVL